MRNRYLLLLLLVVASIWVYGQGIPLESHLMGQNRASTHNLNLLSVGDASVADATVTNATITSFHSVQGFPFDLVGGASGEVLAVWEDQVIRPTDPNLLVAWPEEAPAFAEVLVAGTTKISATNAASRLTILEGTNIALSADNDLSTLTITSLADGSTNPAYGSIAVGAQKADATSPNSLFTFIEGSNVDLNIDTVNHQIEIMAQATGFGNGVPTVIVAASDSLNKASADFQCDGTDDQIEINAAIDRIKGIGGICFLMEGSFAITDSIVIDAPGVELRGSGWHSVINAATNCVANSGFIKAGSSGIDVKGIRIADLTICGNRVVYTSENNNGIWVDNPCQFRIDHVRVMDCAANGIYLDDDIEVASVWVTHSLIISNSQDGLHINQTGGVLVGNCIFYTNGDDGLEMATGGSNGKGSAITGCIAYDNVGWGFYSPTAYTTLSGCNALGNSGDIYLGGNCVSTGCQSRGSDGDGIVIGGNNVNLAGAYVYGSNGDGVVVEANVDVVNISGVRIEGVGDDGIVVNSGCDQVLVTNCWINANGKGAVLSGNFTVFQGNYIYSCEENGIYADGDSDIIQNNYFYDNGGAGSDAAIYVKNDDYIVIQKNRFHDSAGSSPAIKIDADGADDAQYPYITLNYLTGTWADPAIDSSGNTIGHSDFMQQLNALADVYILAGSADARIGIATRENINNVLTISSSAPTNPIANGWDIWSLPSLKENIAPLTEEDGKSLLSEFEALRDTAIRFDWKYPRYEPQPTDFADVRDETGEIVATAQEQYAQEHEGWAKGRAEWEALPHKKDQRGWLITHPNFPERLKARNIKGEAVGVNTSQMVFEIYNAVQQGLEDLEALKKELEALRR